MKIGVIGIGNIARKAYLPVMAGMQNEVEWHLCSRNEETLKKVKEQYGFRHGYTSREEWLDCGMEAAFVHAATKVHYELIRELLERGIHVYVDKPVSDKLEETAELFRLAEERRLLLTCGFNRRFAPFVQQLAEVEGKNMLLIHKDRVANRDDVRFAMYDLFIHPLDTALYLLQGEEIISMESRIVTASGWLQRAWVMLETASASCLVSMNALAGANQEVMEVQSPGGVNQLKNLTQLTRISPDGELKQEFDDWQNTLTKRGFEPLIKAFVKALETGENPVPPRTAYTSHEICETLIQQYEAAQG